MSSATASTGSLVLPGDVLGVGSAGTGAWASSSDGLIRAAVAGTVFIDAASGSLCVLKGRAVSGSGVGASARVPSVNSRVIARVRRVTSTGATCDILTADGAPLAGAWTGVIGREHMRAVADGPLPAHADECFRPGDIVAAVVASSGDAATLFLSTGPRDCGVVQARSDAGLRLAPKNASEMVAEDGAIERRKVAISLRA
jgi:exosome complex RNA-binding protein Csl4